MNNHDKVKQAFSGVKAPDDMAGRILKNEGRTSRKHYKLAPFSLVLIVFATIAFTAAAAIAAPALLRGKTFINSGDDSLEVNSEIENLPFNETLRNYLADNEGTPVEGTSKTNFDITFHSLSEASGFFGLSIIEPNLIYESKIHAVICFDAEEDNAIVLLGTWTRLANDFDPNGQVMLSINFVISDRYITGETSYTSSYSQIYSETEVYKSEISGVEAAIAIYDDVIGRRYTLVFSLNDIVYTLNATTNVETNQLVNILKGLVDTFTQVQ